MDSPQKTLAELSNLRYALKVWKVVMKDRLQHHSDLAQILANNNHPEDSAKEQYCHDKVKYYIELLDEIIANNEPK